MYELYYAEGTACLAPHIVLETLQLPYRLVDTDISRGMHQSREFLAINPVGRIPVLRLPGGSVMTESAAICLYLADLHPGAGLSPLPDHPDRPEFLRWLMFLTTSIQGTFKRYYYPQRFVSDPEQRSLVRSKSVEDLREQWAIVEAHLGENGPFHVGGSPGVVDIFMMMLATWYEPMDELLSGSPAVRRCYDAVASMPAAQTCLGGHGGISVGEG